MSRRLIVGSLVTKLTSTLAKQMERIVVVTGGGKGVGQATIQALLAQPDVRVIAVSRSLDGLSTSVEGEYRSRLELLAKDLLDPDAISCIKRKVAGRRLVGLVHNAGLLYKEPMGQHDRSDLERLFATNVLVPLELSQALAAELRGDPPGHILHIGSMGGFQDSAKFPGLVAYSSSKAALACMAQCLAEEFKDQGIRSNCLALGAVDTEMLRAAFPGYQARVSAAAMGAYIAQFTLEGHNLYNGKVLPVAVDTP